MLEASQATVAMERKRRALVKRELRKEEMFADWVERKEEGSYSFAWIKGIREI